MKSVLVYLLVLVGLLAVFAVGEPKELVRDQFGVREKNAGVDMVEDYDPEKELDFYYFGMDQETVENGVREARDNGKELRDTSVLVEKPAIVPFGRASTVNGTNTNDRARSFVFRNLDKNQANWIIYPYNFTYIEPPPTSSEVESSVSESEESTSEVEYVQGNQTLPDGAMLSTMNQDSFPLHTYMNWIESKTDMNLKKAKVVYDLNIAVLQMEAERQDEDGEWSTIDITYDSDSFCTMFYNYFYPKYQKCFVGMDAYLDWVNKTPGQADRSSIVYVTPLDISKGRLKTKNGENLFGMLIIPDLMMAEVNYVKQSLSSSKSKIASFVNDGGLLLTTGKGAFLAESWGLVPSGTFSPRYTMVSPNQTWQYNDGCDVNGNTEPVDDTEDEFKQSTLCFALPRWGTGQIVTGLISAPLLATPEKSHGMKKLMYFRASDKRHRMMQHDENTGVDQELEKSEPNSYPSVMYKAVGKGHLVVNMGNPGFSSSFFQHVYNAFLLAGSRPIALDNKLIGGFNRTVPALEQVDLSVSLNVVNYFTTDVSGAKLYVFTINGTEVTAPSGCSVVTSDKPAAPAGISVDKIYTCSLDSKKLTSQEYTFSIRVVDVLVTQQKKDVVILWPHLQYSDPNRNNQVVTVSYGVKIQAAASALLRADMNIDPSSTYPLHCTGSYIDNVMNCENKEETYAYRVQHVSIVPVISPLIDILDQIRLAYSLVLDKDYYEDTVNGQGRWLFPFPPDGGDDRKFDYLDWDLLYDRSDLLAADWDEGVKLFRVARTDLHLDPPRGFVPGDHIMNANYQTNNDDDTFLLKQFQFDDADKFYEHAVQRLMAFLDVSTVEGAKTMWGDNIPSDQKMASDNTRGKRRIIFVRHDIFWWRKYLMPFGLGEGDRNTYISLDKYDKNVECGGEAKRSYPGAFGNDVGLIPAEYPNQLMLVNTTYGCRERIDFDKIEEKTNGKIKKIHYIVPVHQNDGKKFGDFDGFDSSTGKHLVYDDIKFVYTYGLNVDIAPELSRRGGEIVFTFNNGDIPWDSIADAVAHDYITVAADQIAVYKIYSTASNVLRIRFKRGQMPNEAYGRASHLQIFFEGTKWVTKQEESPSHNVNMDLYEMHYDIAKPQDNYEDWSSKTISGSVQTFVVKLALSMPALRLQFAINDDLEQSFMNPYELREPLIRYGLYEQELVAHRAVHGSAEFHPKSEPSLVTKNGGFSTFTHVGTSSVPFREYVSTGTSLQIPAATETGRVEWDDIWGRHFIQNVRSTIFEYPPIPPPLRNFVMTTTFEILDKQGKRMLGGWRSNENVDVHVQMKLLNNYPKWFEVTACQDNRVLQSCTVEGKSCGKARIYDTDNNFVFPEGTDDGTMYFKRGQNASYGICFSDGTVKLQGTLLTQEQMEKVYQMTLCAKQFNDDDHSCESQAEGLPTLKRCPENSLINGSAWNFATRVVNYWPEGYIKENMWDLTHYDYDDNQFDKAYKYHMDNNLPHLGHSNTRPDNLIAFPLYKGLGYSMVYDKTYYNKRFGPNYRGWWSDNLQNKDHTLVAGNAKSNDVSVGQQSLIPDSEWFDISLVQNGEKKVAAAEKNVYTCLFNRRNVKNYVKNTKVTELFNVYENNIVPVPIDFDNKMEFNYECKRDEWYTPTNISLYPNTVYTDTARDWLYFGANLRGGALEDINVIYQLSPLETDSILFEGTAKVQDGGRFVYWNPANSKNSYLVVDNPVHVVLAKRNDIELEQELIPTYTTTFDSVVFHHLTMSDPEEIEREWESPIYTNNYGYGDFTVQIYVGDAGTTALPSPGTTIRARITFMNNAGFDINMRKDAITATNVSQEAINADDLMKGIVHALRVPDAYNFLKFEIPDDIKDYIKIYPCPSVVGIAGLFFDFDSINVVTIRDGWKGDYYVNIAISKNFPEEKRGRLVEIPVKLVKSYFDRFPGKGDVTGAHDYEVEVPSIFFGVPYSNKNKLWAGKVFYTSGYATDVNLAASFAKPFLAEEAILVSEEDLELYRSCLGRETDPNQTTQEGEFACLDRLWAQHLQDHTKCQYTVTEDSTSRQTLSFAPCMAMNAPTFPVMVDPVNGPDQAVMHVLVRTRAKQVKSGYPRSSYTVGCQYKDWAEKTMKAPSLPETTVHAKGAWINLKWSVSLLSTSGMILDDPLISPNNSGLAQVTITLSNTGDYYAYNVMFNLTLDVNVTLATENNTEIAGSPIPDGCGISNDNGSTMFWCNVAAVLPPSSPRSYPFRVYYTPDLREGAGPKAKSPLNMRVMATKSSASIDLTSSLGEKRVTQDLEGPYGVPYTDRTDENMVVLTGRRGSGYHLTLTASHKLSNIRVYIWRAKLPSANVWTTIAVTNTTKITEDVFDRFLALGGGKADEVKVDYIVAVSRSKSNITIENSDLVAVLTQSNVYEWRVASSNLLLLLLLLPGLAIPALAGAAIFATTKSVNKEPVRELGMAQKQKFVPQELVDDEPLHMEETDTSMPPPPLPQRAAPTYEPPEPAPQVATRGKQYAVPTGPTYLRAGVPVNVVDN